MVIAFALLSILWLFCRGSLVRPVRAFPCWSFPGRDPIHDAARRHIARNHRACACLGAISDLHRGNEHGVAPDESALTNDRGMLLDPVVVAGDGAGPDVRL